MDTDPRDELLQEGHWWTAHLERDGEFWLLDVSRKQVRRWEQLTELARAILEADQEWRAQNAPTLADLRQRYPDRWPGILPRNCANDCVTAYLRDDSAISHECASEVDALEWLAKELAR